MTYNNSVKPYVISVSPVNLPLLLDEVKTHLKISIDTEDDYLTSLIKVVRDIFESITNRTLINTTYKTFLDSFTCDGILLRKSKLQSITSIQYKVDGVLTLWDSSNYYFTEENDYSSIYLEENKTFPSNVDDRKQAIEILFVAGYGLDDTFIPQDIKQALLNHIAFLYENRGDCVGEGCGIPCFIEQVYMKYKIFSMMYSNNNCYCR